MADVLEFAYPRSCCKLASSACSVAGVDAAPVVPVADPAFAEVGFACCKSETSLVNAPCKSDGAEPLLTCEISADKPAEKPAFGSVAPVGVVEGPDAISLFTAWKRACMN